MQQSGQDWHRVDDNESGQLGQVGQREATWGSIALRPRGANRFTLKADTPAGQTGWLPQKLSKTSPRVFLCVPEDFLEIPRASPEIHMASTEHSKAPEEPSQRFPKHPPELPKTIPEQGKQAWKNELLSQCEKHSTTKNI